MTEYVTIFDQSKNLYIKSVYIGCAGVIVSDTCTTITDCMKVTNREFAICIMNLLNCKAVKLKGKQGINFVLLFINL